MPEKSRAEAGSYADSIVRAHKTPSMIDPIAERIASTFNRTFARSHRTVLMLGGDEPLYEPAHDGGCARIVCNRDYPASVLHEAAHWCLASAQRRRQVDYGYWYVPPPRSKEIQQRFLAAEARNQALEALFARAAGLEFRVSLDATGDVGSDAVGFAREVAELAERIDAGRLPVRAERFRSALLREFRDG